MAELWLLADLLWFLVWHGTLWLDIFLWEINNTMSYNTYSHIQVNWGLIHSGLNINREEKVVQNFCIQFFMSWYKHAFMTPFPGACRQFWILLAHGCFVPSLAKIGPVVLERRMKMRKDYDNDNANNANHNDDS